MLLKRTKLSIKGNEIAMMQRSDPKGALFNMNEIIYKLKNLPFVTGLREGSGKTANPNRHLIIDISKGLITEKDSIPKLYDLLNSQSFFEWTVSMTD